MTARAFIHRLAAALGLGTSVALFVDYQSATSLCGAEGGCSAAKSSSFAHILGIPTPLLGVLFFAGALLAERWLRSRPQLWRAGLGVGALAGLGFLGIQLVSIGELCPYCVIVDLSAVALWATSLGERAIPSSSAARQFGLPVAGAGVLAAALIAMAPSSEMTVTRGLSASGTTDGDTTTIVEFVDFQCPACRALHHRLREVVDDLDEDIEIVRKHMPLAKHAHAALAARAYCCADELGAKEAMADRLFAARALSEPGCSDIAGELSLDVGAFDACMSSDRPDAILRRDAEEAKALGIRALPTLFIGDTKFEGAPSAERLRRELERITR